MSKEASFSVRFMTEGDVDEVEALHKTIFPFNYSRRTIMSLTNPRYLSILMTTTVKGKEKIIGFITSQKVWDSRLWGTRDSYITTFGIHKDYRRKGLGSFLLDLTMSIYKNHYFCNHVMLDMQKSNDETYQFYKKHGYNAQRIRQNYYNYDDKKEDSIFMTKLLEEYDPPKLNESIAISEEISKLLTTRQSLGLYDRFFGAP